MNDKEFEMHMDKCASEAFDAEYARLVSLGETGNTIALEKAVREALEKEYTGLETAGQIPHGYLPRLFLSGRAKREVKRKADRGSDKYNNYVNGQLSFDDSLGDEIVAVAEGEVSKLNDLKATGLFGMDQLKYIHLSRASRTYDNHREKYNRWFPVMLDGNITLSELRRLRPDLF